jgi:hypothetical protein
MASFKEAIDLFFRPPKKFDQVFFLHLAAFSPLYLTLSVPLIATTVPSLTLR